jgi:peptidoglycan hydrolase-like protein with peptidoglycan-binding domain
MNGSAHERQRPPAVYTRRRLIVAAGAAIVPFLSYSLLRRGSARSESLSASPSSTNLSGPAPSVPMPAPAPEPSGNTLGPPPIEFEHAFGLGMNGSNVNAVQDRLRQLGFDPGPSDAAFGPATERAVWAYEKFILDVNPAAVTGVVTSEMWVRMSEPTEVRPRRASPGTHVEILLPQQVASVYIDNQVRLITHISSGSGEAWCDVVLIDNDDGTQHEEGICGVAVTPAGVFHFERRVDGWRNSKLGRLYNPVYFNYGIAVHGASNVPSYPASHGCVRIPMHIAEYFPSLVREGDLVYVFDGVEEPEAYGAQLPVFDYPDPNYTTMTSSSSTTTTAPATTTTGPPVTTVPPNPTTTVGG